MSRASDRIRAGAFARGLAAVALTAIVGGLTAGGAGAHVTPGEAQWSVQRGADWLQSSQQPSGALSSDWAMTALAAAGRNAADVRTALAAPSAQDHYLDGWRATGPGGVATDAERAILAGTAGGIQTSRLSTAPAAERSNLVARVAELWDGTQIGSPGLLNDDIFGVLALHHAGAPRVLLEEIADHVRANRLADGGWGWSASASSADTDITASAVGALCAAGAGPSDPDVAAGLELLRERQDPASGGLDSPPWMPVNSNSTGWTASALIQCGIDPQAPEWTTAEGKTLLDYLLSVQRADGHFDWSATQPGSTAMATFDAVRPLAGTGWSTAAPERLDPGEPAVRPAAAVAQDTTVPITLVIDHGPAADDVRMCRVDVAEGATLAEALAAAEAGSVPAGCVGDSAIESLPDGGVTVERLNGVERGAGWSWWVRIDGQPAETETGERLGLGDLVFLRFDGDAPEPGPEPGGGERPADPPAVDVPPVEPPAAEPAATVVRSYPMVRLGTALRLRQRRGRVLVPVRCPRGNGAAGCSGVLRLAFRTRAMRSRDAEGRRRFRRGRATAFELASGSLEPVRLRLPQAARRTLARGRVVRLRLVAATRAEDGVVRVTRGRRLLAPRR